MLTSDMSFLLYFLSVFLPLDLQMYFFWSQDFILKNMFNLGGGWKEGSCVKAYHPLFSWYTTYNAQNRVGKGRTLRLNRWLLQTFALTITLYESLLNSPLVPSLTIFSLPTYRLFQKKCFHFILQNLINFFIQQLEPRSFKEG